MSRTYAKRSALRLFAALSSAERWAWLSRETTFGELFGQPVNPRVRRELAALVYMWGEV